ncbi:MAG: deaminase [Myxococcales bacterium]
MPTWMFGEPEAAGGFSTFAGVPRMRLNLRRAEFHRAMLEFKQFRQELGLGPAGKQGGTLTKLVIGERSFWGKNAHGQRVTLRVNPISRTHAETDSFQQAHNAGVSGGRGVLYVDNPDYPLGMCPSCGDYGAVESMARQLGLESLTVVSPNASTVVY